MSVTNKKSIQNISLNKDNETITDDKVISNHFNKFFSSVAGKLVKKIPNTTKTFDSYLNKQSEKSFFLLPISPEDVEVLMSTLKVHKAVGPGRIPIIIVKQFKKLLSKPIYLFQQGYFPTFLNKLKLFQYFKKETKKTATIIDLSHSYQILVKLLKNSFIGSSTDFLNLTTYCIPINLVFAIFTQQIMH